MEENVDSMSQVIVDLNEFIGEGFKFFLELYIEYNRQIQSSRTLEEIKQEIIENFKFSEIGWGDLTVMISDLYESIRHLKELKEVKSATWVPPSSFIRSTEKFWVRLEDVTKLKLALVKHLPVLRFGKTQGVLGLDDARSSTTQMGYSHLNNGYDGNYSADDSDITSVYFDNEDLQLYHDKIRRREGATLIRVRWYGKEDSTCFIERKTWHDSWVANASIKERFDLKPDLVKKFIDGKLSPETIVEELRKKKGLDVKAAGKVLALSMGIQKRIKQLSLKPALRTVYKRTAFQLTSNNTIRISIDTNLEMIKEDATHLAPHRWCMDTSQPVDPDSRVYFPLAVLEIKLSGIAQTPVWLESILAQKYIVSAHKFSKFIHGMARLNTPKCSSIPPWFTRPIAHLPGRPLKHWYLNHVDINVTKLDASDSYEWDQIMGKSFPPPYSLAPTVDNADKIYEPAVHEKPEFEEDLPEAPRVKDFDFLISEKGQSEEWTCAKFLSKQKISSGVPLVSNVQVEPKTYFANERTLFRWLHISLIIGLMASQFGAEKFLTSYSPIIFAIIFSCGFSLACLWMYEYRAQNLHNKNFAIIYSDSVLPTILGVFLIIMGFIALSYIYVPLPAGRFLLDTKRQREMKRRKMKRR
eukprot:TRINITY_DN2576_c0_g2_i1.p1 TRINITY_DN2576_c0_g2~~TRINITY_DN2576_c0_g2_i1.p1  ORF type:complete len:725 (-),score=115.42 TRINITY_DN2576_c0_g2_i1:1418-3334(-)